MSTLKEQQSEKTRNDLLAVARRLFAEKGYAAVGTEDIVRAAKVTRGALYHHYRDKEALFAAVVERVMAELHAALAQAGDPTRPWQALEAGTRVFLDQTRRQDISRILFLDAPSVLGWVHWRTLDAKYGLGLIQALLTPVLGRRAMVASHLLTGALTEAAMMLVEGKATRASVEEGLALLTSGLRDG